MFQGLVDIKVSTFSINKAREDNQVMAASTNCSLWERTIGVHDLANLGGSRKEKAINRRPSLSGDKVLEVPGASAPPICKPQNSEVPGSVLLVQALQAQKGGQCF